MSAQKKPVLEPKTRAFIDAVNAQGGTPLYEMSYEDARQVLEDAVAETQVRVRRLRIS